MPILLALALAVATPAGVQADNPEMTAMFDADQGAREKNPTAAEWSAIGRADQARRARTQAMLDAGLLRSPADFYHAAFIFQHGGAPRDYLLAHSLALAAAAGGMADAKWIAAATLDRYLQSIGQPQVYGTQFRWDKDGPVTQEPYDRTAASDALRATLGVPPLASQEERRRAIQAERDAALRSEAAAPARP